MAWTNAWNEAAPAGSALRSTLDDIIRGLKLDMRERLNTILDPSTPWEGATDPLLILAPKRQGVVKLFACYHLQPEEDDDDISYNDEYVDSDNSGNNKMRMSLDIEQDVRITKVEVLFDLGSDTQCTITLKKTAFANTPATSVVATEVINSSGVAVLDLFTGSELSDGTGYYWITFDGNDAGRWRAYAVRLTYDEV